MRGVLSLTIPKKEKRETKVVEAILRVLLFWWYNLHGAHLGFLCNPAISLLCNCQPYALALGKRHMGLVTFANQEYIGHSGGKLVASVILDVNNVKRTCKVRKDMLHRRLDSYTVLSVGLDKTVHCNRQI